MSQPITSPESNKILRASIWVAIGALIAAALVCVVWVLIGDENGIVGKAFLTVLLLAAFAGVAILETNLAARRPAWLALASMLAWVLILLIGAFLIWMPTSGHFGVGAERFFRFILIALIIQGVLLHARLLLQAYSRHQTGFTTAVTSVTIGLVVILGVMLVLPLMTDEFVHYRPLYWRVVVALAILAAVGTAIVPLVNALFAPKAPRAAAPAPYNGVPPAYGRVPAAALTPAPLPWPTFADGVTPLPALPDGTPDWNAYYTGRPTYAPAASAAQASQPMSAAAAAPTAAAPAAPPTGAPASDPAAAPWYRGYPPPPPVPTQPPVAPRD
ncbi:hypothetical protein [Microbacterium lacticum]|uniref:Uncharacterized protein n=1 Tax=Microbacterium lacticum TaxID=33885 RepID=A0A4Y3ULZ4_9MICO|nr:hypothetical protein [Microbacterium lacticum]TQM98905.1 hypothetical protein FHX68_1624 [Microbacterium lacticum]GEB94707.1 hypothetical protein MLA01_09260 [Microbacterium lacticum]GGN12419.1 hypothetical protein GCM10009724_02210 [Microbacterium lacticum]